MAHGAGGSHMEGHMLVDVVVADNGVDCWKLGSIAASKSLRMIAPAPVEGKGPDLTT